MTNINEAMSLSLLKRYWQDPTSDNTDNVGVPKLKYAVKGKRVLPKFNISDKSYKYLYPDIFGDNPNVHRVKFAITTKLSETESPFYSKVISVVKSKGIPSSNVDYISNLITYALEKSKISTMLGKFKESELQKSLLNDTLTDEQRQSIIDLFVKRMKVKANQVNIDDDVIEKVKTKTIKLTKWLINQGLKDLAENVRIDKYRDAKGAKLTVVLSRHPYDIIGMTYGRQWSNKSCMNISTGIFRQMVPREIKAGSIIAYLVIDKEAKNLKAKDALDNPLARVIIKPFFTKNIVVPFLVTPNGGYGKAPGKLAAAVSKYIDTHHNKYLAKHKKDFTINAMSYKNRGDATKITVSGGSADTIVQTSNAFWSNTDDVINNGIVAVTQNSKGKYGMINPDEGEILLPYVFDSIKKISYGRFLVVRKGKKGLVDDGGQYLLPVVYDSISQVSKYIARVKRNGTISTVSTNDSAASSESLGHVYNENEETIKQLKINTITIDGAEYTAMDGGNASSHLRLKVIGEDDTRYLYFPTTNKKYWFPNYATAMDVDAIAGEDNFPYTVIANNMDQLNVIGDGTYTTQLSVHQLNIGPNIKGIETATALYVVETRSFKTTKIDTVFISSYTRVANNVSKLGVDYLVMYDIDTIGVKANGDAAELRGIRQLWSANKDNHAPYTFIKDSNIYTIASSPTLLTAKNDIFKNVVSAKKDSRRGKFTMLYDKNNEIIAVLHLSSRNDAVYYVIPVVNSTEEDIYVNTLNGRWTHHYLKPL